LPEGLKAFSVPAAVFRVQVSASSGKFKKTQSITKRGTKRVSWFVKKRRKKRRGQMTANTAMACFADSKRLIKAIFS
jgi:hypothetical protein